MDDDKSGVYTLSPRVGFINKNVMENGMQSLRGKCFVSLCLGKLESSWATNDSSHVEGGGVFAHI